MEIYKLSPAYLKKAQRRCYRFYGILLPCVLALAIDVVIAEHPIFHESIGVELLFMIGLVCAAFGNGLHGELQKSQKGWERYCFRVSDDSITQVRNGHHDRNVLRSNIVKVMDIPDYLVIKAYVDGHLHFVDISKSLEHFERFRSHLEAWHPIQTLEKAYPLQRNLRRWVFGMAFVMCNTPGKITIRWSNTYLTFVAVLAAVFFLLWCAKATIESPFIGKLGKVLWFIWLGLMFALAIFQLKGPIVLFV